MRNSQSKVILVVEDDDTLRMLISKQLERLGFLAELATNGQEAVNLYSNGDYVMILMDIQMPKMDGFEATEQIRSLEAKSKNGHIPIVAITANPNKKACLERGMDDFIFKPVMLDQLQALFQRWIPDTNNRDRSHQSAPSGIS